MSGLTQSQSVRLLGPPASVFHDDIIQMFQPCAFLRPFSFPGDGRTDSRIAKIEGDEDTSFWQGENGK